KYASASGDPISARRNRQLCGVTRFAEFEISNLKFQIALSLQSAIFLDQIPIGHSGDVIADGAMQSFAFNPPRRGISEVARIQQITFEDSSQHFTGTLVHLRHPW